MALVLGVTAKSSFYIQDSRFTVPEIMDEDNFVIRRADGAKFIISDRRTTQIYPEVDVSSGLRGSVILAKIVFDAPGNIIICRPGVYWKNKRRKDREVYVEA